MGNPVSQMALVATMVCLAHLPAGGQEISAEVADASLVKAPGAIPNLADGNYPEGVSKINYAALPSINVQALGASGDGAQLSTPYFERAARALLAQGGGVIFIPKGVYVFRLPSEGLSYWEILKDKGNWLPLQNLHFVGEGEGSIIRFEQDPRPRAGIPVGWSFGNVKNVSLRGLSFDCFPVHDVRGGPFGGGYAVQFGDYVPPSAGPRKAEDVQVVQCRFDKTLVGPWFLNATRVAVIGCDVRNTTADGIHFDGTRDGVAIRNYVENSGDDLMACIADASHPARVTASDNLFADNTLLGSRFARGITMGGTRLLVRGNWVERVCCAGIHAHAAGHHGEGFPLVDIAARENVVLYSNLAERADNPWNHAYRGAVKIEDACTRLTVAGNKILWGEHNGIFIASGRKSEISGVRLENNDVSRNRGRGIAAGVNPTLKDIALVGNRLSKNLLGSLFLEPDILEVFAEANLADAPPIFSSNVSARIRDAILKGFSVTSVPAYPADPFRAVRSEPAEAKWAELKTLDFENLPRRNVKDFGAMGDGVHNDAPAFAAALRELEKSGGRLIVPSGVYRIEASRWDRLERWTALRSHLEIRGASSIQITGEGDGATLLFTDADAQGLRFVACEGVDVSNLTFLMEERPPLRRNRSLLDFSGCTSVFVDKVIAKNSSGFGLEISACTGVSITHSTFQESSNSGLRLAGARQVVVEKNQFLNNRDHGIDCDFFGVIAREPQYIRISENIISGTREGFGVAVQSGDNMEISRNRISGTYQAGVALYIHSAWFHHGRVVIEDNVFQNSNNGELAYTEGVVSVFNTGTPLDLSVLGNVVEGCSGAIVSVAESELSNLTVQGNRAENSMPRTKISEEQRKKIAKIDID